MAKLTTKEQAIFEAMCTQLERDWSAEEIGDALYGKNKPKTWRHTLLASMRILEIKTAHSKIRVRKTSALGRGHQAIFRASRSKESHDRGVDLSATLQV